MTIPGDKRGVGGPSVAKVRADAKPDAAPEEKPAPAAAPAGKPKIWGARGAAKTAAGTGAAGLSTADVDRKLATLDEVLSGSSGLRAHRLDLVEQLYLVRLKDALLQTRAQLASGGTATSTAPVSTDDAAALSDALAATTTGASPRAGRRVS